MAKAAIRRLKARRFNQWMLCEIYQKPAAIAFFKRFPVKQNKRRAKINPRKFKRMCEKGWVRAQQIIEDFRQQQLQAARGEAPDPLRLFTPRED